MTHHPTCPSSRQSTATRWTGVRARQDQLAADPVAASTITACRALASAHQVVLIQCIPLRLGKLLIHRAILPVER